MKLGGGAGVACALQPSAVSQVPSAPNSMVALPPGVEVEKDVVVGESGKIVLHCDLYRPPAGTKKNMALIHFHGGAFIAGNKASIAGKIAPITARGYLSVAAQYRLGTGARWPSQIEDAKLHIRWVREHADALGVDPKKIGLVGYSAGGYIALYTAAEADAEIAAVVAFYAAHEVTPMVLPEGTQASSTSIDYKIHGGFPPTILYHGLADQTIPPENSLRLLEKLRDSKVPCELHTFTGVPHEFDEHPEFAEACAPLTDFFLEREVIHPRTYPPFQVPGQGPGAPGPG